MTELNHFRLLGRSGLRVSPLCLGTMTFGTDWNFGAEKEECRRIFDLYLERGGNFIDTANNYTNGTSETFLGEFIGSHREELVLATKYTLNCRPGDPNAGGNHRKNMVQSVEASLKRLQTDYIDLYWVHCWEFRTPIEEIMRALDDLVRAGKILYVAISDAPAWKIAQANTIANLRGWTPFIGLQSEYNLIERTPERELIPMAEDFNIGLLPWSPLGGGLLTGKHIDTHKEYLQSPETSTDIARGSLITSRMNEQNLAICEAVQKIAQEIGHSPAQVSLNWLLQKSSVTSIILGAKTVKQLEDNLGCLDFTLTPEQMQYLDEVSQIKLGFPHDFINSEMVKNIVSGGSNIAS
ncbi:aldo/keto reductase [Crocosphaera sp.]|uniref:aldo/keto reductase n=1 Tax=Crocosphaera sp. TaxID=2729996 RepID=UPI00343C1326